MRATTGIVTAAALVAVAGRPAAAERFVLAAVVSGVDGVNGSFWETEVRILRLSDVQWKQNKLIVRRAWVATPGGGFEEDPATAPTWTLDTYDHPDRMLMLTGRDLLAGTTATHGAVALDVVAGRAIIMARNANTGNAAWLGYRFSQWVEVPCCSPGNGQASAPVAELSGPSVIAWGTGGDAGFFRMNVGLVNAGASPLHVSVTAHVLAGVVGSVPSGTSAAAEARDEPSAPIPLYWYEPDPPLAPLEVDLPPWGWRQLNDLSALVGCNAVGQATASACQGTRPLYVTITPAAVQPYYAYGSVVYSPLNDPEFVQAVPGTVDEP